MKPKILVLERSADLAEVIREAAAGIDPSVEVLACNRVGAVSDVLHQQGPFTVLFAGPSLASRSGLRRLAAIHEECPATSIVLAFAQARFQMKAKRAAPDGRSKAGSVLRKPPST